jgi:hypothetical protein
MGRVFSVLLCELELPKFFIEVQGDIWLLHTAIPEMRASLCFSIFLF